MKQLQQGDKFVFETKDDQTCYGCYFQNVDHCPIIPRCYGGTFVFKPAGVFTRLWVRIVKRFKK